MKIIKNKLAILLGVILAAGLTAAASAAVYIIKIDRDIGKKSNYEAVADYISENRDGLIAGFADNYVTENLSPYETREDAVAKAHSLLSRDGLTFAAGDGDSFTVFCGGYEFLSLAVSDGEVISCQPVDAGFFGEHYTVSVPHGSVLSVNGISPDKSGAEKTDYPFLTEFEKELSADIYCDSYDLGILFSVPELSAELDGEKLEMYGRDGGRIIFLYPLEMTHTEEFSVPYGAEVKVNGITPPDSFISDRSADYPFLTRYEENVQVGVFSVRYRVSGLFGEITTEASYDGEKLTCDSGGNYRLPDKMTHSVTVEAPDFATVRLNGIAVGQAEITRENIELPILDGVTGYAKNRPYLTEYTVDGLIGEPSVSAHGKNGELLLYNRDESTADRIVFESAIPSAKIPEADKITVLAFAKEYVRYYYGGSSSTGANFNSITGMTPGKSAAYLKLKAAYKSIGKLPAYTKFEFGVPSYLSFREFGNAFSSVIELPFTAKLNGEKVSLTLKLDVLYVFSGKIRRVINYNVE